MEQSKASIKFRQPRPSDVDDLYRMILDSTGGKTKITATGLRDDLFNLAKNYNPEVQSSDLSVNFDSSVLHSNRPIVQAILAQEGDVSVGYLMFQYYYSPWIGFAAFVVDIFTNRDHRNKGIAKMLLHELSNHCKTEDLKYILINTGHINQDLISSIVKQGFKFLRNKDSDWSVLRIDFN